MGRAGSLAPPARGGRRAGVFQAAAWLVASLPLGLSLWASLSAAPEALSAASVRPFSANTLSLKLSDIFLYGLVPSGLAYGLLVLSGHARFQPRRPALQAATRAAAVTVALVAMIPAGLHLLTNIVGHRSVVAEGLWSGASPELVFGLSILGASAEELLFRGVLLTLLLPFLGVRLAAIVQAALFGLVHLGYGDPWYTVAAFAFGLLQAYLTLRWGLLAAILVHAQVNLVILGWSSRDVSGVNAILAAAVVAVSCWLLALAWWDSAGAAKRRVQDAAPLPPNASR